MPTTVWLTVRARGQDRNQLPDRVKIEQGTMKDLAQPRILLLVHGFANPEQKAHESYEKFAAGLTAVSESFPDAWGAVCEFHWPGDDKRGPLASKGTYSFRIAPAHTSAIRLVEFLHEEPDLKPDLGLYIVAHSLGCRVALEVLREIRERKKEKRYNGQVVREVALMAAAVPVGDCLPPEGEFKRDEIPDEHVPRKETRHEHVLYSRRDRVLHYTFWIGQVIAGEHGHAVGRDGLPDGRWDTRTSTGLEHGEYWEKHAVAERVSAIVLGTGPVELPVHHLPTVEFDIADPPWFRRVAERLVSWRG